ncbi:response regulator transcription factor [Streptomyces jumonjinensis]|uniref:Response regulator transcription factor n=1 Tax=Streptomyces jumonjinensis TaxID=1945 RepID=A0A646KQ99_STRJU|nr:response regulator transcription factor [Streptomyces jumonjinensis]
MDLSHSRVCPRCLNKGDRHALGSSAVALERVGMLSRREYDVFLLLPNGPSNRDLSYALNITERTAKAHVASILKKLALGSRLQACLTAWLHLTKDCPRGQ